MSAFVDMVRFEVEQCCKCGLAFAVTADFQRRRLDDHALFYCPSGHGQHYNGPTETQKLKTALERKDRELQLAMDRANQAAQERETIARAHQKMRVRVMNGVCPCCNRTFQSLMEHMKSEHADFAEIHALNVLRKAFGMTQADVAREAGVKTVYVSLHERERPVPSYALRSIERWVEQHKGKVPS